MLERYFWLGKMLILHAKLVDVLLSCTTVHRRQPQLTGESHLTFSEGGIEGRRQDDDDEDVHAFDALHAGWGGGEEGGDCRVKGGSKRAGGDLINQNGFKT